MTRIWRSNSTKCSITLERLKKRVVCKYSFCLVIIQPRSETFLFYSSVFLILCFFCLELPVLLAQYYFKVALWRGATCLSFVPIMALLCSHLIFWREISDWFNDSTSSVPLASQLVLPHTPIRLSICICSCIFQLSHRVNNRSRWVPVYSECSGSMFQTGRACIGWSVSRFWSHQLPDWTPPTSVTCSWLNDASNLQLSSLDTRRSDCSFNVDCSTLGACIFWFFSCLWLNRSPCSPVYSGIWACAQAFPFCRLRCFTRHNCLS